jgi:PAS domain-containing protein
MSEPAVPSESSKSLPLILARELASNLATPMFLLDARGLLVYFNEAAARLIGKEFTDLGEIPADQFAEALRLSLPDGQPLGLRESPAGIAFFARRPAHRSLMATSYDGVRRQYEATAYPLFGAEGEMHGVFAVFWQDSPEAQPS